jgi:ferritin-like metal-binding protein YciE
MEDLMKILIEKLADLKALYIEQLRFLLSAEEQILRAFPNMLEAATDTQLKQVFQSHLQETEVQSARLREILGRITDTPSPLKCKTIAALIDEEEDEIQSAAHEPVRDAALITVAQRMEHYQIASYGTVRHFARVLGLETDAELLNQSVHEESHADHLLTSIAERLNPFALQAA